jgi:hypothetical protein
MDSDEVGAMKWPVLMVKIDNIEIRLGQILL